jgi:membrane-bound lytic murein transglycosylase B
MALHRLQPDTTRSEVMSRSMRAVCLRQMEMPLRVTRATRNSALTVATLVPLLLSCAVSGGGHAPHAAPAALGRPLSPPVAVVAAVVQQLPGPAVVAAAHPPSGRHVAAPDKPAPILPAAVVNTTSAVGIPSTALAAYRNAEQKMAASDPGCGISWNLLAGIGRIESGHANGGATDARGTAVRPIYGPALDGTLPGNEVITERGGDGRVSFVRAVGPMQFLPGTWAHYASDGDGDGVADPQNLYDSTLAAARYLCSGGMNLRDQSQVMTAILRYNNSASYARNVLGWAAAYATGVVPVDLPPVSGPAPPIADLHLESSEGLGPGLPLNIHGLPPTDPLSQKPLIDLGPSTASAAATCTVICIESQSAAKQPAP